MPQNTSKQIGKIRYALKNPKRALRYSLSTVNNKFKVSQGAKVSNSGERLFVKDWNDAKKADDFTTFAHIQRYEWVLPKIQNL
jgi:hypothetical protein